jgi:hypothetical protein
LLIRESQKFRTFRIADLIIRDESLREFRAIQPGQCADLLAKNIEAVEGALEQIEMAILIPKNARNP